MKCDCDICKVKEDESDDWEIQRLEDIITICEALIKHKKRAKQREPLKKIIEDMQKKTDGDVKIKERDDGSTSFTYTGSMPKGKLHMPEDSHPCCPMPPDCFPEDIAAGNTATKPILRKKRPSPDGFSRNGSS